MASRNLFWALVFLALLAAMPQAYFCFINSFSIRDASKGLNLGGNVIVDVAVHFDAYDHTGGEAYNSYCPLVLRFHSTDFQTVFEYTPGFKVGATTVSKYDGKYHFQTMPFTISAFGLGKSSELYNWIKLTGTGLHLNDGNSDTRGSNGIRAPLPSGEYYVSLRVAPMIDYGAAKGGAYAYLLGFPKDSKKIKYPFQYTPFELFFSSRTIVSTQTVAIPSKSVLENVPTTPLKSGSFAYFMNVPNQQYRTAFSVDDWEANRKPLVIDKDSSYKVKVNPQERASLSNRPLIAFVGPGTEIVFDDGNTIGPVTGGVTYGSNICVVDTSQTGELSIGVDRSNPVPRYDRSKKDGRTPVYCGGREIFVTNFGPYGNSVAVGLIPSKILASQLTVAGGVFSG